MTKADIERIKGKAKAAHVAEDYNLCFSHLKELDALEFIIYSEKQQWIIKGNSACYFWSAWLLDNEAYLERLVTSPLAMPFLYNYFSKTRLFNKPLEQKLALKHPNVFVEAIKKNRVFLRDNNIDFLLYEIALPSHLQIHQKVWAFYYKLEQDNWNSIQQHMQAIKAYAIDNILQVLTIVIESKRYKGTSALEAHELAESYSFFLEVLFKTGSILPLNTSAKDFEVGFIKSIKRTKEPLYKLINQTLTQIVERRKIVNTNIDPYSFDDNVKPNITKDGTLTLACSDDANKNWLLDGERYIINEGLYFSFGEKQVEESIQAGNTIPGKNPQSIADNREMANKRQAIALILKDLFINHFYKDKAALTSIHNLVTPLQTLAFNRLVRYQRDLDNFKENMPNWELCFFSYSFARKTDTYVPFLYSSKQEYRAINKATNPKFNEEVSSTILDVFGEDFKDKRFDRLNPDYSVFEKPFLKIGDYLFCPIPFLTAFTGIYTYVCAFLKDNNKDAEKIEALLVAYLKGATWEQKLIDNKTANKINGDADIILSNDRTVLLIQVKRTKLRLDSKAIYNENTIINRKAALQLNSAEQFFNKKNKIFKIGNREVKKWIVTTSFEEVNTTINSCRKLNYFEIINCIKLMYEEHLGFDSLEGLINYFESDPIANNTIEDLYTIKTV